MNIGTPNLVDRLIVASPCPWMANYPVKGALSGHVNHLHFGGHQPYLRNGLSYSRQILYTGKLCQVPA